MQSNPKKNKENIGQPLYPKIQLKYTNFNVTVEINGIKSPLRCYNFMGDLYFLKSEFEKAVRNIESNANKRYIYVIKKNKKKYPFVVIATDDTANDTVQKEFFNFASFRLYKDYMMQFLDCPAEMIDSVVLQIEEVRKELATNGYYSTNQRVDPFVKFSVNNAIKSLLKANSITLKSIEDRVNWKSSYLSKHLNYGTLTRDEINSIINTASDILGHSILQDCNDNDLLNFLNTEEEDPESVTETEIPEETVDNETIAETTDITVPKPVAEPIKAEPVKKEDVEADAVSSVINSHIDFLINRYGERAKEEYAKRFGLAKQRYDVSDDVTEDIFELGRGIGDLKTKADYDRTFSDLMKKAVRSTMLAIVVKTNPDYKTNNRYDLIYAEAEKTIRSYVDDVFWDILGYKMIYHRKNATLGFDTISAKKVFDIIFDSGLGLVLFERIRVGNIVFSVSQDHSKEYKIYDILLKHFTNNICKQFSVNSLPVSITEKILRDYWRTAENENFFYHADQFTEEDSSANADNKKEINSV